MAGNIILIGFMGVGKGRIARALVERTGRYAIDTDDLIESLTNMKIRKIFAELGEPYFRNLEQRTADWLNKNVSNTVISTGGGFHTVKGLGKNNKVVYLHSSLEAIMEELASHPKAKKKIKKRPLLQDMQKAGELYAKRIGQYRKAADLEINVERRAPEEVADRIITKLHL